MLAMRWGFTALADALTIASDNGMARFYHSLRTVFAAFLAEPIPLSSCKVLGNVKHGDGEDSEEKETDLVPIDLPDIGIHATEMPPTATEQRACLHALDAALTATLTASASQLGPVEKQHALRFMRHLAPVHSTHPSHLYHILNSGGLMSLARQDSSVAMTEAIEMRSKLLALLNTDGELVAFLGRFGLHPPIEAAPLDDLAPVHYLTYYLRERAHVDLSAGADALGSTGVSAQKWFRRSFKLWLLQIVGGGGAAAGNEGALLVQGFEAAAARVYAAGGFEPAALGRALPTSGLPALRLEQLYVSTGEAAVPRQSVAAMLTARPGYGDAIFVMNCNTLRHKASRLMFPSSRVILTGAWRAHFPWMLSMHDLLDIREGENRVKRHWRQVKSQVALSSNKNALAEIVLMQKRELEVLRRMRANLQVLADDEGTEMLLKNVTAQLYNQQQKHVAAGASVRLAQAMSDGRLNLPEIKAYFLRNGMSREEADRCSTADQLLEAGRVLGRSLGRDLFDGIEQELPDTGWAGDESLRLKNFYLHTSDAESLLFSIEACLPDAVPLDEVDYLLVTESSLQGDSNPLAELLRSARLPSGIMLSSKVKVFRDRPHMLCWLEAYQGPPHSEAEVEQALNVWRNRQNGGQ